MILFISVMPLKDEERLFIEVLREVNHQASVLQAVEKGMTGVAAAAAEAAVGVAAAAGATAGAVYLSVSAGTPESDKENSEESKHGAEGTQSSSHADVPATYPSKANALSAAQEEIADTADIAEDATGDGCGDGDVENREAAHRLAAHNLDIATASVLEAAQRYQSSTRAANDGDHVAAIKAAAKNGASAGAGVGAVSGSKRSASQADLDKSNKSNKSDKSESN